MDIFEKEFLNKEFGEEFLLHAIDYLFCGKPYIKIYENKNDIVLKEHEKAFNIFVKGKFYIIALLFNEKYYLLSVNFITENSRGEWKWHKALYDNKEPIMLNSLIEIIDYVLKNLSEDTLTEEIVILEEEIKKRIMELNNFDSSGFYEGEVERIERRISIQISNAKKKLKQIQNGLEHVESDV